MTRVLIVAIGILAVVGVALAAAGVLHVQNSKDETGIIIDKKQLDEKTQDAVKKTEDAGGKILNETGDALHKAADEMRSPSREAPVPSTTPPTDEKNGNLPRPSGKNLPEDRDPQ